jgi:hypothetical protein
MDGKDNKDQILEDTLAQHPKMSVSEFEDVWSHLEEEAV